MITNLSSSIVDCLITAYSTYKPGAMLSKIQLILILTLNLTRKIRCSPCDMHPCTGDHACLWPKPTDGCSWQSCIYPGPALAHWQPCSQWCIAKNIGGYTLETRRQRHQGGWGSWGGGVPLPSWLEHLGSVVRSCSGVQGRAPAANAF